MLLGKKIDVPGIMFSLLKEFKTVGSLRSGLSFSILITILCEEYDISCFENEKYEKPNTGPITPATIKRMEPRRIKIEVEQVVGEAEPTSAHV